MPIFRVELVRETELILEAADIDAAKEIAGEISEFDLFWDTDIAAHEVDKLASWELVDCDGGTFEYSILVALNEWIDAVEKAEAIDPNQIAFNV